MSTVREKLNKNAEEFDSLISELKNKLLSFIDESTKTIEFNSFDHGYNTALNDIQDKIEEELNEIN